jgi:hypothetical protein
VVLKSPKQDETEKVSHDVEAHISTNNILCITLGGSAALAEFQADAYLLDAQARLQVDSL